MIIVHVTFALVLFVLPSFRLNWKSDFILMIFNTLDFIAFFLCTNFLSSLTIINLYIFLHCPYVSSKMPL